MHKKLHQLFVVLAFFGLSLVQAQTTILDETLLTQQSFNTFTAVSVTGPQEWNFNSQYGAVCSGFTAGQSYANEDWFVSPAMNLTGMGNVTLNFSHTRGNASVMNVGVSQGWYKAFATANYTGNPATTQWVELTGLNQNITNAWQYISSGNLIIPAAAKSATTRVAFRYMCSNSQSATWEIKNVKVTGQPENTAFFKVTNWNVEWLGCTDFGPDNESQQLANVAAGMLTMDADVYCLQEVINTPLTPTIQSLLSLLGTDAWGGAIVPSNTGECNQRQAIIYKKAKVELVNSLQLNNGNASPTGSYSYNWSGGRFPAVYNVNFKAGNVLVPVSLVNIHAKAEDNNASSYQRRQGGATALKTILDGANYNTKNVIIIGDYNDYLIGTSSNACQCTDSPFKNFMDDTANYKGITAGIINVNNWYQDPVIENIIISNELNSSYVAGSAAQETGLPQTIQDYDDTTSHHLPISASFQFSTLSTDAVADYTTSWTLYPNPVKDVLNISTQELLTEPVSVYDITGRQVAYQKLNNNSISVGSLPAGIYILKIGAKSGKFIKQ